MFFLTTFVKNVAKIQCLCEQSKNSLHKCYGNVTVYQLPSSMDSLFTLLETITDHLSFFATNIFVLLISLSLSTKDTVTKAQKLCFSKTYFFNKKEV